MIIPPFQLTATQSGDIAGLKVVGELDLETAPQLAAAFVDLADAGTRRVTVDLADLDFIDSTGLTVLVAGMKRLHDVGGNLALESPNARIMKVLEITGLANMFTITRARASQ